MKFRSAIDRKTNKSVYVSVGVVDLNGRPIEVVYDEVPEVIACEYTETSLGKNEENAVIDESVSGKETA